MIFPMIIVVIAAVIISTGVLSADFFRCCNCCRLFTETVLSAVIVSVVLWTAVVSVSVRTIVIVSISLMTVIISLPASVIVSVILRSVVSLATGMIVVSAVFLAVAGICVFCRFIVCRLTYFKIRCRRRRTLTDRTHSTLPDRTRTNDAVLCRTLIVLPSSVITVSISVSTVVVISVCRLSGLFAVLCIKYGCDAGFLLWTFLSIRWFSCTSLCSFRFFCICCRFCLFCKSSADQCLCFIFHIAGCTFSVKLCIF